MPTIEITSSDDPQIAAFRDLPARSEKRQAGFVVEGPWLVQRLLDSEMHTESVLIERARLQDFAQHLHDGITVFTADKKTLQQIVGFQFHRSVLAVGRRPKLLSVEELAANLPTIATIAIVDGVSDPENLGGLLRNCAAFGVNGVMIGPNCADPYSRRVLRVGMGSVFKLNVVQSNDLAEDVASLRTSAGFKLFASVIDTNAEPLDKVQRTPRVGLMFGNEADGLGRRLVELSDQQITIPMRMDTDSLNVAVASGIFLFHFSQF